MKTEFLAKAEENLTAAQVCFENGLFNACANRAYYAALHAAVAALAHKGRESAGTKLITDRCRLISAEN